MSNFQTRLKEALSVSALNKGELADETDVALSTVSRWFKGTIPKTDKLEQVANTLGVNAKWLLTGNGDKASVNLEAVNPSNTGILNEEPAEYFSEKNNYLKLIETNLSSFDLNGILDYIELLQKETPPGWQEKANAALAIAREKLTKLNQR